MTPRHRKWMGLVALLLVGSLLLSACGEEEPEVIEKEVTRVVQETVVETVVEKETVIETVIEKETVLQTVVEKETVVETVVEEVVVTAMPEGATVGGTFVWAIGEPDTLDVRLTGTDAAFAPNWLLGAMLVAKDLSGQYIPWLAESWTTSEDGLVWEFKLREGVKFHDGTPMTAEDYAWSFNELLDPEKNFPQRGRVAAIEQVEVVDDYTFRLTLSAPYPVLLEQLSNTGVTQPLSQEYVERLGDQYGRQPMGVGPYVFKEWMTSEKIVLERNPDYQWAQSNLRQGPFYIQNIEFRIITEYSTILSGLESGEIDYAGIEPKDLQRFQDPDKFQIIESQGFGMDPVVHLNVSMPPLDDVNVRQAMYFGVDRDTLIRVVIQGHGAPNYGPLTPDITGYWAGVEEIGGYDLDKAQALLDEAGWTDANGDGIREKDGEPLKLVLKVEPPRTKLAEFLQEQYKALGIDIEIQLVDQSILWGEILEGTYQTMILAIGYSESDILYRWYSGSRPGALNPPQHSDDELNEMLDRTRTTVDPAERQEWLNKAQQRIAEQAYIIPLYSPKQYAVLSARVKGAVPNPLNFVGYWMYLNDAYIEE